MIFHSLWILCSMLAQAKRDREIELQKMFNRRIFESFHNMKDAFTSVSTVCTHRGKANTKWSELML